MIFGAGYGPMDMRNGTSPYNGPEYYLSKLIGKELANFYGIPDWSYGGVTDAKCLDTQAATEASLSTLLTKKGMAAPPSSWIISCRSW